ncbi:MAG: Snf7 family protein [Candidatus Hodarchaeales archaeon]
MGRFKKFISGSKPKDSTRTIAQIQKQLNAFQIRSRALQRQADEEKALAKKFLGQKNRVGAAQALKRHKQYMVQLNKTHAKMSNLRRIVSTIQTTGDNVELMKVLKAADSQIEANLELAGAEQTEEMMGSLEERLEEADMVDSALSDDALTDIGLEDIDGLDEELGELEAEMNAESAAISLGDLPAAGTEAIPSVAEPAKEKLDAASKAEMEKLKRELEQLKG